MAVRKQYTALQIDQLRDHGRHAIGGGLYLEIDSAGKRWLLRYQLKGKRTWGGGDLYYMDCVACLTQLSSFTAKTSTNMFRLSEGRFNLAAAYSFKAEMRTGTCTKF